MFNLSEMRADGTFEKLMEVLKEKKYWFLDQDIMNKVFEGRVHFLPMEWNVFHGNGNTHEFFPALKFSTYSRFLKARLKPSMVHFAGDQKPWKNTSVDFADLYWSALRETGWYEEIFRRERIATSSTEHISEFSSIRLSKEEKLRKALRPVMNRLLPRGSSSRNFFVKVYITSLNRYRSFFDFFKGN